MDDLDSVRAFVPVLFDSSRSSHPNSIQARAGIFFLPESGISHWHLAKGEPPTESV